MKTKTTIPTPVAMPLPESLSALKENARRIEVDRQRLAREQEEEATLASWCDLGTLACQMILAELRPYCRDQRRPADFTGATPRFWLTFDLPGHASIRCRFDRDSAGTWTRSTPDGRLLLPDGEGQLAWQATDGADVVNNATLGECLLAAERMARGRDDDGRGVNLAALANGEDGDGDIPF
jgi:hypothetical protein